MIARIDSLVSWARERGARLHPSVEVYSDPETGYSMRWRARHECDEFHHESLDVETEVVTCPTSLTISYINALVGPIEMTGSLTRQPSFPASFIDATPPFVVGRFFLMQQYLGDKQSPWFPYIQSLPQPENVDAWILPAFWPEEDAAKLEATNAAQAAREMRDRVRAEFRKARKLLKAAAYPDWPSYTRILYEWAFCIFTTRSFRPLLVLPETVVREITPLLPHGCKLDDFSVLQPLLDVANHSPTAKVTWVPAGSECRLLSSQKYNPGQQMFNNYGVQKTNGQLLVGYGFMIPDTFALHNDYVHIRLKDAGPEDAQAHDDEATTPLDWVISLRPMTDASSVAGRARQPFMHAHETDLPVAKCFGHLELSMLLHMADKMATAEERQSLEKCGRFLAEQHALICPPGSPADRVRFWQLVALCSVTIDESLVSLVESIRLCLLAKCQHDLDTLEETIAETEAPERPNGRQKLAIQYRSASRRVLRAATESLGRPLVGNERAGSST